MKRAAHSCLLTRRPYKMLSGAPVSSKATVPAVMVSAKGKYFADRPLRIVFNRSNMFKSVE